MRILYLIPFLTGGGAQRQTGYLAEEMERRGHDVLVAYSHYGYGAPTPPVPARQLPVRRLWSPLQIIDVLRLIREWKPDLVQTCLTRMDVVGGMASRLAGVPFVIREANSTAFYAHGRHRIRVLVGRSASAIVANSPDGAEYWRSRTPKVPLQVVRNGIPVRDSPPIERPANPVGVYTGRLFPEKNVDVLLRACALVDRNITLFICGNGTEPWRLQALAKELNLDARFPGFVADPTPYQRAADFAALLSDHEGHPNAVGETFAAGTPMILSDVAAHREFADAAVLVPPRDVEATAAAIRSILDERPVARIERARTLAAQWSVEAMASAYEQVYVSVLRA